MIIQYFLKPFRTATGGCFTGITLGGIERDGIYMTEQYLLISSPTNELVQVYR